MIVYLVRVLSALLGLVVLPTPSSANFSEILGTTAGSGIAVRVSSPFPSLPSTGAYPLRLTITNGSNSSHAWTLEVTSRGSSHGTYETNGTIHVDAGQTKTLDLIVPLPPLPGGRSSSYHHVTLSGAVSGHAIDSGHFGVSAERGDTKLKTLPYTLVGARSATALPNELAKSQSYFFRGGAILEGNAWPTDWRAYSGVERIFLESSEWEAMPPSIRGALEDWALQGGQLYLGGAATRSLTYRGLGTVVSGPIPDEDALLNLIKAEELTSPVLTALYEGSERSFEGLLRGFRANSGMVVIVIFLYAIAVGPINLRMSKQRGNWFLYVTTPLISLAAALILIVTILLQDGTGGRGRREVLAVVLPKEQKIVRIQEQISKTGLLGDTSFASAPGVLTVPLDLSDEEVNDQIHETRSYRWSGNVLSGDWFRSRSLQKQLLASIDPSRFRVTIVRDGGALQVRSTVGLPLRNFHYWDAERRLWHANAVNPGQTLPLLKSVAPPAIHDANGLHIEELLARYTGTPRSSVAEVGDPNGFSIPTLASVEWNPSINYIAGVIQEEQL